jgi:hypothetical protein
MRLLVFSSDIIGSDLYRRGEYLLNCHMVMHIFLGQTSCLWAEYSVRCAVFLKVSSVNHLHHTLHAGRLDINNAAMDMARHRALLGHASKRQLKARESLLPRYWTQMIRCHFHHAVRYKSFISFHIL